MVRVRALVALSERFTCPASSTPPAVFTVRVRLPALLSHVPVKVSLSSPPMMKVPPWVTLLVMTRSVPLERRVPAVRNSVPPPKTLSPARMTVPAALLMVVVPGVVLSPPRVKVPSPE